MRIAIVAAMLVSSLFIAGTAVAGNDDLKWVGQCLVDNADAKVAPDVVAKYCACMNQKMDDNETQTITQWEKTHATERKACEAFAGWK